MTCHAFFLLWNSEFQVLGLGLLDLESHATQISGFGILTSGFWV